MRLTNSFLILSALSTSLAHSHPASKPIERDLSTSSHSASEKRSILSSSKQRLRLRDASTVTSGGKNNEGEAHGKLSSPDGAFMKDLAVGNKGDEIMLYWSRDVDDSEAEQAFVVIHGKLRDGDNYWQIMNRALTSAVEDGVKGASNNSLVVAPQFFSTIYNEGQYSDSELAWGDVNAWQAGDPATHPSGTTSTSFDALDAIVEEFSNQTHYSSLKNLTLVGHGGGGQLMQRYAVVGEDGPSHLNIRYITGDPSSSVYFTEDRPTGTGISKSDCELYNTWRYGFDNFTGTLQGKKTPQEYFEGYVKRDLVALVANDDTSANGDQYCMAKIQGGTARRDRSLNYWAYIQTLAGTGFDLSNWPGHFDTLPDWSHLSGNWTNHNLVVIENVGHNPDQVFGSDLGRSALFESDKNKIQPGWRPAKFDFKLNNPIPSLTSDSGDVKDSPTSVPNNNPINKDNVNSTNTSNNTSSATAVQSFGFLSLLTLFSAIFFL